MILKAAVIHNIKSYYPEETVYFEDKVNIFVGTNGSGKSNLFEIIQGVVNNIIYRHITLGQNPNRQQPNHPSEGMPFALSFDNIDQSYITTLILDRNSTHQQEEGFVELKFIITPPDIEVITNVWNHIEDIQRFLKDDVAQSEQLLQIIDLIKRKENYDFLKNKEIVLKVDTRSPQTVTIVNIDSAFSYEEGPLVQNFIEITKYLNVFHELSNVLTKLGLGPVSRYFSPHRMVNQIRGKATINLSAVGNYEDSFTKGTNQNKESSGSTIDSSYTKLVYLFHNNRLELIEKYKRYIKEYIKLDLEISRNERMNSIFEYNVLFSRTKDQKMRLSSGEKEFFNLITGLILSGIHNGIIFIDEPELHLHFKWQQAILKLITNLAREFNLQFFVVTHSPKLINKETLIATYRVYLDNQSFSHIHKPSMSSLAETEARDLVQFLATTNNEKVFFSDKIILVEGPSDLIIIDKMLDEIVKSLSMDIREVDILYTGSKYNLFKFRKFLNNWNIKNYIISDLDFLKDLTKNQIYLTNEEVRQNLTACQRDLSAFTEVNEEQLKKVLLYKGSKDGKSLLDLIINKGSIDKEEFVLKVDELTDYILQRASGLVANTILPDTLKAFLKLIAEKEHLYILNKGTIEKYFPTESSNKIDNALKIIANTTLLDSSLELQNYINTILKD